MKESDVAQLVKSLKDNAERLGLVWTRRFGTVVAVSTGSRTFASVQMDAPTDQAVPIDCVSLCGQLTIGSRVAVDSVPPAGKFIVGVLVDADPQFKLVKILQATATNSVTLTTSSQDIPGVTVTYSSKVTHTYCAWGVFDFAVNVTGNTTAIGFLDVGGAGSVEQALLDDATVTPRATVAQNWSGSLAAGSHTLKTRCFKSANVGTLVANTHSTLLVHVYEPL